MTSDSLSFGKQDFGHIYNCEDPRPYFTTLRPLDYRIHRAAIPILARCAKLLAHHRRLRRITVVDVCAGYGINAALLRHGVSLDDLYDLYDEDDTPAAASHASLLEKDKRFFAARRHRNAPIDSMIAIDRAPRAVRYAEAVGLVDHGAGEDLERNAPSDALRARLASTALITVTGGMGYVSPQTFEHILTSVRTRTCPWIVAFPLVTTPLDPFRRLFASFGLRTEVWEQDTFSQRRFADQGEHLNATKRLQKMGLPSPDPDDYLQTRLICARPALEADRIPLHEIAPSRRHRRSADLGEMVASP